MKPGRQRRVTAKLPQPAEGPDERVLRQLPRFFRVAAHSEYERVHAGRVRVIQLAPGQAIARDYPGDELSIVHPAIIPGSNPRRDIDLQASTRERAKTFGRPAERLFAV